MALVNKNLALLRSGCAPEEQIYTRENYLKIPQMARLPASERHVIDVVSRVFPFKTNNYVVNELIDWERASADPIYRLVFPQRGMLNQSQFQRVEKAIKESVSTEKLNQIANDIRLGFNPHPAGQLTKNVPFFNGKKVHGIQHKYRQTVLFFPDDGQSCYSFCTFCFRWPQFTSLKNYRISLDDAHKLCNYLQSHHEITDIVFTGGDPLFMSSQRLASHVDTILKRNPVHVENFRFGSRALSFWPYRFLTDDDADELLNIFSRIIKSGRNVSLMAHFNHPGELKTTAVREAIARLRSKGVMIRTQSPLVAGINDRPEIWSELWRERCAD